MNGFNAVVVRLSQRPDTRLVVSFDSDSGRSTQALWDPVGTSLSLTRVVRLAGHQGATWYVSVDADRNAVPTPDSQGQTFIQYKFAWTGTDKSLVATGTAKELNVGTSVAWQDVAGASPLVITLTPLPSEATAVTEDKQKGAEIQDLRSISASLSTVQVGALSTGAVRSFSSPVPDAVQDVLQLLAEIAVDRAEAEGVRIFKAKVVKYVCTNLTLGILADDAKPSDAKSSDPLLPATCGQLSTLRITDLGSTAKGLLQALREDFIDVVLPAFEAKLKTQLETRLGLSETQLDDMSRTLFALLSRAARSDLRPEDIRVALLGMGEDLGNINPAWKAAIIAAADCVQQQQGCTVADLDAFVLAADANAPATDLDLAQRFYAVLQPGQKDSATALAEQLVQITLDLAKTRCSDTDCTTGINSLRDVAIGLIDADYLRAIGGASALVTQLGLDKKIKGNPLELLSSAASYIETYTTTQNVDATKAHDLRKQALEGIIDAATDRTNRAGDTVVSLGASVGFTVGDAYVVHGVKDHNSTLHDLRLPLGVTVQHLPGDDESGWHGWFLHASLADLAQFVSSPLSDTKRDQKVTWSDFVSPGLQLGWRLGSPRVPVVIAADVSWLPRVTLSDPTGAMPDVTTSVFHIGVLVGFNVPFFDLN